VQLRHTRVQPDEAGVVVPGVAVVPADAAALGEDVVIGGDDAALAGDQHLGRREAEHLGVAEPADHGGAATRAEGVGGVEEQPDPVAPGDLGELLHVAGRAVGVGRQDGRGAHPRRPGGGHRVKQQALGPDVGEHRPKAVPGHRVRGRREGERRQHHVAGQLAAAQHQHEPGGAGGDRHAVLHPQVLGGARLQLADGRAVGEDAAGQDRVGGLGHLVRVGDGRAGQRQAVGEQRPAAEDRRTVGVGRGGHAHRHRAGTPLVVVDAASANQRTVSASPSRTGTSGR